MTGLVGDGFTDNTAALAALLAASDPEPKDDPETAHPGQWEHE